MANPLPSTAVNDDGEGEREQDHECEKWIEQSAPSVQGEPSILKEILGKSKEHLPGRTLAGRDPSKDTQSAFRVGRQPPSYTDGALPPKHTCAGRLQVAARGRRQVAKHRWKGR